MNSKGFTIIELTAVIVVLVAIFLVSFPSFMSTAKVDNELEYNSMVDTICLSGKAYIHTHKEQFEDLLVVDGTITLDILDLIKDNYIEKGTVNVKTEKIIDNDTVTFTVLSDYSLDCKYNG